MTFPANAPSANPVFYRTYSRRTEAGKESWLDTVRRCTAGLAKIGNFTVEEEELVYHEMLNMRSLPSGRWLWVGGTPWVENPDNFSGAYNCTSTHLDDPRAFAWQMALLMMGCGTGAVIEPHTFEKLPVVTNDFGVIVQEEIGSKDPIETTYVERPFDPLFDYKTIVVGDSRQGWCDALEQLILLYMSPEYLDGVIIDLSHVRPPGSPITGFGGTANPVRLAATYRRVAEILKGAKGRRLTSIEACLILDESSMAVVAGNVRRSAGMRQFASTDEAAAHAKDNLWQQGDDGKWRIDPERDALRMANHTRVFHRQPTLDEIRESVTKQFYSGEGAIQYAPEAIARANVDVLDTPEKRQTFLDKYEASRELASAYLTWLGADNVEHRMQRYGLNPCGEIIGKDFHCNLSEVHLNTLDPSDLGEQHQAFKAAALAACALLHHKFTNERYQYSREIDPIIGVSFTGLFDFFVTKWGASWLDFWAKGRPEGEAYNFFRKQEAMYLRLWRGWVHDTVQEYCSRHGLRVPNRFTTVQPAGTKSLLTGASPGWHPPKAARFIRRITFAKDDPVALACERFGYRIIPSQSDRDETGALLEDPRDPRCTEWLVEIPTHTTWADLPGCDQYDVSKFSAAAQLDFYMQVQRNYTTHNTSATIEFREAEIEELSSLIHQALGNGYVSAALLARFDSNETFPRLPFEPISHAEYDKLVAEVQVRQSIDDFHAAMNSFSNAIPSDESGPAACDSDKCLFSAAVPR